MYKTYKENNVYYAVITTASGHTFYIGPYKSRSSARRGWFRNQNLA